MMNMTGEITASSAALALPWKMPCCLAPWHILWYFFSSAPSRLKACTVRMAPMASSGVDVALSRIVAELAVARAYAALAMVMTSPMNGTAPAERRATFHENQRAKAKPVMKIHVCCINFARSSPIPAWTFIAFSITLEASAPASRPGASKKGIERRESDLK